MLSDIVAVTLSSLRLLKLLGGTPTRCSFKLAGGVLFNDGARLCSEFPHRG